MMDERVVVVWFGLGLKGELLRVRLARSWSAAWTIDCEGQRSGTGRGNKIHRGGRLIRVSRSRGIRGHKLHAKAG